MKNSKIDTKTAPQTVETKKIPTIETTITELVLVLTFAHGKTIEIDASTLSKDIQNQAMMHGLKQKLVDAAAISRNPETGREAKIEDKFEAVEEVASRLKLDGGWNKQRAAGEGSGGGLLLRALCELYPRKTRDELREFVNSKSATERAALRATDKVAALILTYRASNADGDSLLDELN
jgi:hypothetical protein